MRRINNVIVGIILSLVFSMSFEINEGIVFADSSAGVMYTTHVQKKGWLNWSLNGSTSGTSGQSLRVEALQLKLTNADYTGSIQYRAYCQTYGWKSWVSNGEVAGTSGEGKRVEAIQVKLTGEMANNYDVYYRVYCQSYGWLGWAKNGETAGTSSYAKRVEAVQVKLVDKNGTAPGTTTNHYVHPMVKYKTHVQTYGWQGWKYDGAMAGTSGKAKRLEGINISLVDAEYSGSIQYRTHVQSYGWMDWKSNGAMSGTSGQAKRLEAIQIKLTGEMAIKYDIYYRVHAQKFGWLGWAKNGASAGTVGYAYRLEGIEIRLVPKGSVAPGSTSNAYKEKITPVAVTGVSLNKTTATVEENASITLKATVSPANATNKSITWSSSNTAVATVSNSGVITGKKVGTATITAKTSNGKMAKCNIVVNSRTTIENVTDLLNIDGKSGTYKLVNDIDMDSCSETIQSFNGILEGNGYSISNLKKPLVNKNYGEIRNLKLKNVNITSFGEVAAIAIYNVGSISNCEVSGSIEVLPNIVNGKTNMYAAGIACYNHAYINNCKNYAQITADASECYGECNCGVAGIAAYNNGTTNSIIVKCCNYGELNAVGSDGDAGGIVYLNTSGIWKCLNKGVLSAGKNAAGISVANSSENGIIMDCYNVANIYSNDFYNENVASAGIVFINMDENASIMDCYNTGNATSGLVRFNSGITGHCYYLDSCSNEAFYYNDNKYAITNKSITKSELVKQSTFDGFDFENIWIMTSDGPRLREVE